MGILVHCVLLLLFNVSFGLDVSRRTANNGQTVFRKSPGLDKGSYIEKRSVPAWLAPAKHMRSRRSTDQGSTCKALQGYDTKLSENTHSVSLPLRSGYYV